jgi:hypothetical protein
MLKIICIMGLLVLSNNTIAEEHKNYYYSDKGCSKTTYCADGYTSDGFDRLSNPRDYIYPKKEISIKNYIKSNKFLDSNGFDQYGFNRLSYNKENINFETLNVIEY